jgi:hypothetical protein
MNDCTCGIAQRFPENRLRRPYNLARLTRNHLPFEVVGDGLWTMGTMNFNLPADLAADMRDELERASVAGGQDGMPYPSEATIEDSRLTVARRVDESGCLHLPWSIDPLGQFMTSSATLMERQAPYWLLIELARGKVNQLRTQAAEWVMGGLLLPDALGRDIVDAARTFGHAVSALPDPEAGTLARETLHRAFQAAHQLVECYAAQVFRVRHHRQPRLDTLSGCRLQSQVPADLAQFSRAFNAVAVPLAWNEIEPEPGKFDWGPQDALVSWATAQGHKVQAGPLIDFSGRNLPDWLWERDSDLFSLAGMLGEFVERAVRRYQGSIHIWQVSAGSNHAGVLATRDEELLWLTARLAETVRKVNPQHEVIVGLAHPWGDYLAEQPRNYSPFVFADTLLRTGLKLSALELEVVMGISPRGSYCRDSLELSRLLDLYAMLGVPLQLTVGYPSAGGKLPNADPDQRVGLGQWRDGFTPATQADWTAAFVPLALCKPYVRAIHWAHWSDAEPHQFPHCGVLDSSGRPKAAIEELARLRGEHLK